MQKSDIKNLQVKVHYCTLYCSYATFPHSPQNNQLRRGALKLVLYIINEFNLELYYQLSIILA